MSSNAEKDLVEEWLRSTDLPLPPLANARTLQDESSVSPTADRDRVAEGCGHGQSDLPILSVSTPMTTSGDGHHQRRTV